MLLLHVYDPTDRPADQVWTWEALARLEVPWGTDTWHLRTPGQLGYAKALAAAWGEGGDLVVVEQDIVPRTDEIAELVACHRPFCAFDYRLSHGVLWSKCPGAVGFGLSRITKVARNSVAADPPVPQVAHRDVCGMLADRLPPVHVHQPPVEHHHGLA